MNLKWLINAVHVDFGSNNAALIWIFQMLKWDLFSHQVKVFLKASDKHTDLLDDIRIEALEAKRGMTSI